MRGSLFEGGEMSQAVLEERRIKELFKEALLEVLQERGDLFYDLVVEVVEREEVYRVLEGGS